MPATKKTPAAKKVATKKPMVNGHWVLPIMQDALDTGEFWTLGQMATIHSQHEKAVADGKLAVAARRFDTLKQYAALHVSRFAYAAYEKARNDLVAKHRAEVANIKGKRAQDASWAAFHEADAALGEKRAQARARAVKKAGIPA